MHISEGVLSATTTGNVVLGVGVVVAAAGTAIALRRLDYERVPRVALLSAAFFVVSYIHIPLGGTEIHLVLNGLIGLILGWAAFPALLIALLLQALFFNYGGLTTLGINTVTMALPAVVCHYLYRRAVRADKERLALAGGMAAGATGVVLAGLLVAGCLLFSTAGFKAISVMFVLASLVLAAVEAMVTGSAVLFLRKVAPELLDASLLVAQPVETSHG